MQNVATEGLKRNYGTAKTLYDVTAGAGDGRRAHKTHDLTAT